jgi:hypothetical protein
MQQGDQKTFDSIHYTMTLPIVSCKITVRGRSVEQQAVYRCALLSDSSTTTGPENSHSRPGKFGLEKNENSLESKVNKPNYRMHCKALCSLVGFISTNYMRNFLHLLTRSLHESGITISTGRLNEGVQL